jgi:hypothetical protein
MRRGISKETRGTAYVVYEDIYDAKTAVDHLSGFNVANRYLIVLYYNATRQTKKVCTNLLTCCVKNLFDWLELATNGGKRGLPLLPAYMQS